MATGVFLQAIIYISMVLCTNWRQVADSAQRNIAFPENNARYNSNQSDTESSSLTASNFEPSKIKYYRWCQYIAKLLTVAIFVSSFVIGLGFSFKQSLSTTLIDSDLFNNSSLNGSLANCPY